MFYQDPKFICFNFNADLFYKLYDVYKIILQKLESEATFYHHSSVYFPRHLLK